MNSTTKEEKKATWYQRFVKDLQNNFFCCIHPPHWNVPYLISVLLSLIPSNNVSLLIFKTSNAAWFSIVCSSALKSNNREIRKSTISDHKYCVKTFEFKSTKKFFKMWNGNKKVLYVRFSISCFFIFTYSLHAKFRQIRSCLKRLST